MNQGSISDFSSSTSENGTTEGSDYELGPWPDELPAELQIDQYPPILSNDPITDSGEELEVKPGDVDCYRAIIEGEVRFFGFLLLQQTNSTVYVYCIHTGAYSTFDAEAFAADLATTQRHIYRDVVES